MLTEAMGARITELAITAYDTGTFSALEKALRAAASEAAAAENEACAILCERALYTDSAAEAIRARRPASLKSATASDRAE